MTRSMNHSPTPGLHIRRILLRPDISDAVLSCQMSGKGNKAHEKNPLVIRRTYDVTAACTRQNTDTDDAAISMHFRGDQETPLLRCAVIGAAAVGIAVSATLFFRVRREWQVRRKYARRYADRLKEQRLRMKIRHTPDASMANASKIKT